MIVIFLLICSQLEINPAVGNEIDSSEAKQYHIFSDVNGFISAHFSETDDMMNTHMKIARDSTVTESTVVIDRDVFKALGYYITHFRMLVEDEIFRNNFVQAFEIGWPIISHEEIQTAARSQRKDKIITLSCCVTGGCALGAYAGALLARKIRTEVDTLGIPLGCWAGNGGCTSIPVVVTRDYYRFNPLAYAGGAAIGSGLGYLLARHQNRSRRALSKAIAKDIVAFDNAGFPITEEDISISKRTTNELLFGSLGIVLALAGSSLTAAGLMAPWSDKIPEEPWQSDAISASVVAICCVEFYLITDFFLKKGQTLDRRATIERLKERTSSP